MDFSLSSSLVGSAVLSADKLALDLQFAADKTLTARKGPTPVFTRGSSATFVDGDGLIKYGPENLLLQSENFLSGWTTFGTSVQSVSSTNPFGGAISYKLTESAANAEHGIFRTSLITTGLATASIYAKEAGRRFCYLRSDATTLAVFDLIGGTVTQVSAGTTAFMTDAGNGWWRLTFTSQISGNYVLKLSNVGTGVVPSTSYLGNGTSGIFIWGAQLERFSTSRTYLPTTTSVYYGPRFDHDPVTGVCKGLLMEESRTNLSLYSGVIVNNIGWVTSQVTSVVDGVGPDGNNAYTIAEDTSTNVHALANTGGTGGTAATSFVSGTSYTGSIFVKKVAGSVDWVQLSYPGVVGVARANFNLNTGTLGSYAGVPAGTLPTIQAFGNGWYRCSLPVTSGHTGLSNNLILAFTNNTDSTTTRPNYAGSTANKVLAAMCQFELGAFPTSYIPTTTASVVRSADVCSITGSAFTQIWNGVDISVLFKGVRQAPTSGNYWALSSGSGATSIVADRGTTTERLVVNFVGIITFAGLGANQSIRVAHAIKQGDYAGSLNGSTVATSSSSHTPTLNKFDIGNTYTQGIAGATWISEIKTFRKRLPNAKLQALTV